jgi:hypothetical protein
MSSITAGAMVYQTRVLQDQFSATVWPYLAINAYYGGHNLELHVANEGVGPALIRSAQVAVDGKPMAGWTQKFFTTVFGSNALSAKDPLQDQSMDASTAIRAGDDVVLLKMVIRRPGVIARSLGHDVTLRLCYCSINDRCWRLEASSHAPQASIPATVPACKEHYSIAAPTVAFIK